MAENKAKKVKNLTLTELRKQDRALNSQTEHTIFIGDSEYKFKVDNFFRQTKQHRAMEDLIEFFNEGNKRVDLLDLATPYTSLLLIKYFTSIEVSDDIDEAVDLLSVLVDLNILGEIINAMPDGEVVKMYETLSATVSRMTDNINEMQKEAESISDKIENQEVKDMLENGEE